MREVNLVLRDILEAINVAMNICFSLSYEQFNERLVENLAVQRIIQIVSEAVRHLPAEELGKYPEIPWPRVKAMGNILRHEYHRLDDKVIWEVVRNELPALRASILRVNPHLLDGDG
jgi:uncharacterized protein with HEPN domain